MTSDEEIRLEIEHQLGIDLSRYRDEEVAESILDLLLFPKYILKWIFIPLLASFFVFILGFFIIDLVHIEFLIYGILGLSLFMIVGVLLGVLFLARQLRQDLAVITDYSFSVLSNSISDASGLLGKSKDKKAVLGLLFKGVVFVLTIPMVGSAIDKKIRFGGGIVKRLMNKSLSAIASKVDFGKRGPAADVNPNTESKGQNNDFSPLISASQKQSLRVLNGGLRFAVAPFRIGLYIFLTLLVLFIYIIW